MIGGLNERGRIVALLIPIAIGTVIINIAFAVLGTAYISDNDETLRTLQVYTDSLTRANTHITERIARDSLIIIELLQTETDLSGRISTILDAPDNSDSIKKEIWRYLTETHAPN